MREKKTRLDRKVIVRAIEGPIIVILIVFISAGELWYPQGIIYSLLNVAVIIVTYITVRNNPQLINERLNPKKGIKAWDKVYFLVTVPLYFITIIIGPIDAARTNISGQIPGHLYILSVILFIIGHAIFMWARKANNYFSSVVRIQKDRGHTVCSSGPYRFIRHPGYLGGILYTIAAPILLGSFIALIPALISSLLIIVRTILEDRTLKNELAGYRDYAKRVRYRLLPFIW